MKAILTLSCPDRPGIVAAVAGFLSTAGCNILDSAQYGDPDSGRFFMRVQFAHTQPLDALHAGFAAIARPFALDWAMHDAAARTRALIMVSRGAHCLNDLLFRTSIGALPIEPVAVASNHDDLRPLATQHGVPFHHIPVARDRKAEAEARLATLHAGTGAELIVLARYMQVLSDAFCAARPGGIINIHHSFLPSFKGAKPYHQAHARGVKLIGATAHYVTADLDEGPIIEQQVARVTHAMTADEMAAAGRDLETQVLARAVKWHAERRVLIDAAKTVVFA